MDKNEDTYKSKNEFDRYPHFYILSGPVSELALKAKNQAGPLSSYILYRIQPSYYTTS